MLEGWLGGRLVEGYIYTPRLQVSTSRRLETHTSCNICCATFRLLGIFGSVTVLKGRMGDYTKSSLNIISPSLTLSLTEYIRYDSLTIKINLATRAPVQRNRMNQSQISIFIKIKILSLELIFIKYHNIIKIEYYRNRSQVYYSSNMMPR